MTKAQAIETLSNQLDEELEKLDSKDANNSSKTNALKPEDISEQVKSLENILANMTETETEEEKNNKIKRLLEKISKAKAKQHLIEPLEEKHQKEEEKQENEHLAMEKAAHLLTTNPPRFNGFKKSEKLNSHKIKGLSLS